MTNDMNLTLTAKIEYHDGEGCVGWIESIKGLVVQAPTHEKAYDELVTSVKVKLAFDWGIPYSDLIVRGDGFEKSIYHKRIDTLTNGDTCEHELILTRQTPVHASA